MKKLETLINKLKNQFIMKFGSKAIINHETIVPPKE
jgi:hypothetical protein